MQEGGESRWLNAKAVTALANARSATAADRMDQYCRRMTAKSAKAQATARCAKDQASSKTYCSPIGSKEVLTANRHKIQWKGDL